VVVVVAVVVLVRVLGGGGSGNGTPGGVARVEGTPAPQREDRPPLHVDVPPVTPEANAACPGLMGALPLDLAGEPSRPVQSDSPFAYAWGDPPVVLVCGVDRPAGFTATASLIQINGVQWLVDTSDPGTTVWTAVDRPVYVRVTVPSTVDSGPVTVLSTALGKALEFRTPQPGP
jgi:Protein of unknown function (DUF3515)